MSGPNENCCSSETKAAGRLQCYLTRPCWPINCIFILIPVWTCTVVVLFTQEPFIIMFVDLMTPINHNVPASLYILVLNVSWSRDTQSFSADGLMSDEQAMFYIQALLSLRKYACKLARYRCAAIGQTIQRLSLHWWFKTLMPWPGFHSRILVWIKVCPILYNGNSQYKYGGPDYATSVFKRQRSFATPVL